MPVDISAPLPDLQLRDQSVLEVDTGDPGAVITQLVIHLAQGVPEDVLNGAIGPYMFVPGPTPVGNPGDGAEASRGGQ